MCSQNLPCALPKQGEGQGSSPWPQGCPSKSSLPEGEGSWAMAAGAGWAGWEPIPHPCTQGNTPCTPWQCLSAPSPSSINPSRTIGSISPVKPMGAPHPVLFPSEQAESGSRICACCWLTMSPPPPPAAPEVGPALSCTRSSPGCLAEQMTEAQHIPGSSLGSFKQVLPADVRILRKGR